MTAERTAYIQGLRELANLLDSYPFIPLPTDGTLAHIGICFLAAGQGADRDAAAALLPDGFAELEDGDWRRLRGRLGGPDGLKAEFISWNLAQFAEVAP